MNAGILLFKDNRVCLISNNYVLGAPLKLWVLFLTIKLVESLSMLELMKMRQDDLII